MGLFGNRGGMEDDDIRTDKIEDHRRRGFDGPIDQNGDAVMGRTDGNGRARGMFDGGDGYGKNGEPRYTGRRG